MFGGAGVVQPGDRVAGPLRPGVVGPGCPSFDDREVSGRLVALHANLVSRPFGYAGAAPALDTGDIKGGHHVGQHVIGPPRLVSPATGHR